MISLFLIQIKSITSAYVINIKNFLIMVLGKPKALYNQALNMVNSLDKIDATLLIQFSGFYFILSIKQYCIYHRQEKLKYLLLAQKAINNNQKYNTLGTLGYLRILHQNTFFAHLMTIYQPIITLVFNQYNMEENIQLFAILSKGNTESVKIFQTLKVGTQINYITINNSNTQCDSQQAKKMFIELNAKLR
ncbi:hypothetical protein pb186bvf_009990 [Paramecium bursaria]